MKKIIKSVWEDKRKFLESLGFTKREVTLIKIAIEEGLNMYPWEVTDDNEERSYY